MYEQEENEGKKYRKVKIFTSDIIQLFKEYCKKMKIYK